MVERTMDTVVNGEERRKEERMLKGKSELKREGR